MPSACFEPEGSFTGRWLYVQVRHNLFTCQRYKQSSKCKSVFGAVRCRTHFVYLASSNS